MAFKECFCLCNRCDWEEGLNRAGTKDEYVGALKGRTLGHVVLERLMDSKVAVSGTSLRPSCARSWRRSVFPHIETWISLNNLQMQLRNF